MAGKRGAPSTLDPTTTLLLPLMAELSAKEIGETKGDASEGAGRPNEEMEDWDKTRNGATPANETPSTATKQPPGDRQYKSLGRANGRSLAELMSPHASKGKELIMTEEEEQRLAVELGNWASRVVIRNHSWLPDHPEQINTDTNPYETPEDSYFKAQTTE